MVIFTEAESDYIPPTENEGPFYIAIFAYCFFLLFSMWAIVSNVKLHFIDILISFFLLVLMSNISYAYLPPKYFLKKISHVNEIIWHLYLIYFLLSINSSSSSHIVIIVSIYSVLWLNNIFYILFIYSFIYPFIYT